MFMPLVSDIGLVRNLVTGGLANLPPDRLGIVISLLEKRAVETGLAAPLWVAEALQPIDSLFDSYSESGGIREGFLQLLDERIRQRLGEIEDSDTSHGAALAKTLRDEITSMVRSYDVHQTYE